MRETLEKAENLVFIGKVIEIQPIEGADFIVAATVVCGKGGKWRGVCKKQDFEVGSLCIVYLPDSLIPESEDMAFMKSSGWRVKMRRFKGAPSEVLIMPVSILKDLDVGTDITSACGVTKYFKPIPAHLQGKIKGVWPGFLPKTDELNYQRYPELVEELVGKPYYITEKADGSSTTAYRFRNVFGVCSRNWELQKDENNGYWQVAIKYKLEERLPEGYAIQWETCGPGIQSNPMGLKDIEGFVFSGYYIPGCRYLTFQELLQMVALLEMEMCPVLDVCNEFSAEGIESLGEGFYSKGKPREGVVVRSLQNYHGKPISFKVINLDYER